MQRHVVEYAGRPVGIVVPFDGVLKFVAVKFEVIDLDGQRFRTLPEARRAVESHLSRGEMAA
jgi:hypothetical protein